MCKYAGSDYVTKEAKQDLANLCVDNINNIPNDSKSTIMNFLAQRELSPEQKVVVMNFCLENADILHYKHKITVVNFMKENQNIFDGDKTKMANFLISNTESSTKNEQKSTDMLKNTESCDKKQKRRFGFNPSKIARNVKNAIHKSTQLLSHEQKNSKQLSKDKQSTIVR